MPIQRYTRVAVVLHWLLAVLILANIGLALVVDLLPDDWVRPAIDNHKSIGISVLGLVLLRGLWRIGHPPPPLPASYPAWEQRLSKLAHWLFYALMLALPISGWMHDSAWKDAASHPMHLFGLVPWPRIGWIAGVEPVAKEALHDLFGAAHTAFGYALYALLTLHIVGALKHQWLDRQPQLQRMML
jgi:cytochrome b561